MANGVFRSFNKDNRPLSWHLEQRFLRPLSQEVAVFELGDMPPDALAHGRVLAERARVLPPEAVSYGVARQGSGEYRPTDEPGVKVATTRSYIAVQMAGDLELLEHWPDEAVAGLLPVGICQVK